MWWVLATAMVIIIIVVIVLVWFSEGWGRGGEVISGQLGDEDEDGVMDTFDNCPDSPNNEVDSGGCTENQRTTLEQ